MAKKTQSPTLSRRDFVTVVTAFLGAIMGAVIGLPTLGFLISPALKSGGGKENWISAGALENYPVGEPTPFSFTQAKINGWERTTNSYGVYVLRQSDTDIKVFSNICTHLSCRVTWRADAQQYICPCHDARFDENGAVVTGPPPRPLDQYAYKIEDGKISIQFAEV
jgi:menaquinol-cytochrome c reductase iron-sulfur subunit